MVHHIVRVLTFLYLWSSCVLGLAQSSVFDSLINAGQDAYYAGDYDTAESIYLAGLERVKNTSSATLPDELDFKKLLGDVYRKKRDFQTAFRYYDEVIERADGVDEDTYIWARQNRSIIYYKQYKLVKSLNENLALLPRVARSQGEDHLDYGNILMNAGLECHDMNDYLRAEEMMLQALEVFKIAAEPNSIEFNRIYNNLGMVYRSLGDYPRAIEYGEKALKVKLINYAADHPSVSKYYYNLGGIYLDAQAPQKALSFFKKSLSLDRKNYGEQHFYTVSTKGIVGDALAALQRYQEALAFYATANDLAADDPDATHPDVVRMYLNAGYVYQKMQRYDAALEVLELTERRLDAANYVSPAMRVDVLLIKAAIRQEQGEVAQAIEHTLSAIQLLSQQPVSATQLPTYQDVTDYKQYIIVLEKLAELAALPREDSTITTAQLQRSFSALETAISTIQWLRTTYHSNAARQYLNNETEAIFTKAVGTAYELYQQTGDFEYLKKAFYLAEASKANILRTTINEGIALRSAGIPPTLLDSLDDLRHQIGGITEDIETLYSENATTDLIDSLKNQRFHYNTQHAELVHFFEENYPAYYALKFGQQTIELETLRQQLERQQTTLLSYFYDDQYVYCFQLNADGLTGSRQAHQTHLAATVAQLRNYLTPTAAINATVSDQAEMKRLRLQLSDWLLPTEVNWKENQRLLVIPHGLLYYLPFELLSTEKSTKTTSSADYLIQKHPVYYSVSADFWVQNLVEENAAGDKKFIGFAPQYNATNNAFASRSNWSNLQWNVAEVQTIQQLVGGQIYTAGLATKEQFRSVAPQAEILHLAMHATIDDQQPLRSGLIFSQNPSDISDQKLNLYEIYNLDLNAKTAVINACNTGYGQLAAGEGVRSLAHAFTYAGARNTLLNLWLTDDKAASQIVIDFYKNLQTGQDKAEALRQAKIQYLAQADPLRAHPYFWAGLVLQGGEQQRRQFPRGLIFGSLIGLLAVGWWGWRKR